MSDSNNFHHSRRQRKLLHKHFSFQFPTSYLKFDFHLVCFIKPPQSDLKGVAGNYPAAEGKKWQWGSSNSPAQKEQGGEGLGSLAEKQSGSTRNLLSVVWPAQPRPHSAAGQPWGGRDSTVHSWGQGRDSGNVGSSRRPSDCAPACTLPSLCTAGTSVLLNPPLQPWWGWAGFPPRAPVLPSLE